MNSLSRTMHAQLCFAVLLLMLCAASRTQELFNKRVSFSVLEGQPPGIYVGSIAAASGSQYRFNEDQQGFRLNSTSGDIFTTIELDREAPQSERYDLVVLSSQPTYPIEVHIEVLDVNDNAPTFPESSSAVTFLESTPAGKKVILDTATDGDAGLNDVTDNYRIVSGNQDDHFRLEVTTNPSGEAPFLHLEVVGRLDWETKAFYQLNISAEDGGTPKRYGYQLVNVTIVDTNDNPPIFDQSDYTVSLNESVPAGTHVLDITATDADDGDNAVISYLMDDDQAQFEVDRKTGRVVTLQDRLSCYQVCAQSRTCNNSCVFTVRARDHGSPSLEGRAYITVNLLDDNDHAPVIKFNYRPDTAQFATVNENAKINEFVAAVSVTDADKGANGQTSVQIATGNERGHFRLDSSEYNLILVSGVLDREKINKYNLTVVATDMGSPPRSTTASLIIFVNDINDHAPAFDRSEYAAVLSESVAVGTFVASITATDEDTGINSNIIYSISSGNNLGWFQVDSNTGLVTTKAQLDRETKDSVVLGVKASDGGPNPKGARTQLKITILDENDESPRFSESVFNTSLSESAAPNTLVEKLTAVDRDQGTNGTVSYYFQESVELQYPGMFLLDSANGRVTTKTKLDRETIAECVIQVVARDHGSPPLSSTATINLQLLDVNDNSPEMYPNKYFAVIPGTMEVDSDVIKVAASDRDEGENAVVNYEISQDDDKMFRVDRTSGTIRLQQKLSWFPKAKHVVRISASDMRGRRAPQDAVVDIFVDRGQFSPIAFAKSDYYSAIEEDSGSKPPNVGRTVANVGVRNSTLNGKVVYSIIDGNSDGNFQIDSSTGKLTTARRVDREETVSYTLKIVAVTKESFGIVLVEIEVTDVNDSPPRFEKPSAVVRVEESRPVGHAIFLASARDSDIDANSKISYSFTQNPDEFLDIDTDTGMIYLLKKLDDRKDRMFEVEVLAADGGTPSLKARQKLSVIVTDVNDHTPLFSHPSYETSLLESRPVNDQFFLMSASDRDEGVNGVVSYNITKGNGLNKFGIFPDGWLFVKTALDREERDYFSITVVASDHGNPARSSSVSVIIHVVDENDHPPIFANKSLEFYLQENMPPDSFVGKVFATDSDTGRNAELTYSFGSDDMQFSIDPHTGFIKSLVYFDREFLVVDSGQDYFRYEVVVADNGMERLRDTAEVIIHILDANDNKPVFTRLPQSAEISESAPNGTLVTRISAIDADIGPNGDLIYSIVDGNQEEKFRMDMSTGQITVAGILDRETSDSYLLTVAASDASLENPMSAVDTIDIFVLDENDNQPEFTQTEAAVSIPEDTPIGSELMQFQATDPDLGINQEVSFGIFSGSSHGTFRIDTRTATLYLDKSLDYEQQTSYNLSIIASDAGKPSLTSTIAFSIYVLDVNDNAPMFPHTAIVKRIDENTPIGRTILTVRASDLDSGHNGRVAYSLARGDSRNPFNINSDTGEVFVKSLLDRETADSFDLTVVATDLAQPESSRRSSTKHATIVIGDINDNAPRLVSMDAVLLPRDSRRGFVVAQIEAFDADVMTNGRVTYRLADGDRSLFHLNPSSGALALLRDLASPASTYKITVTATDEADQRERKSTDFVITVIGGSTGSGPRFSQTSYSAKVRENEPEDTRILDISARSDSGGHVEYYITNITSAGQPASRLFAIDPRRGFLTTTQVLDRETGSERYEVEITAIIAGGSPGVSKVKAVIEVEDVNDSPPLLTSPQDYNIVVSEDVRPGAQVALFSASDPDSLGQLVYSVVEGDEDSFRLVADSGALLLRRSLDRERRDRYSLTIRVSDGVQHTDRQFIVQVEDMNDSAPQFTTAAYSFDVAEDTARGARVGAVLARDPDLGRNGQVTYTVISDWANDVFSLDSTTGVITLTSMLDFELVQHYVLTVQAQDHGQPSLTSTSIVYINVQDVNDNEPIFDPQSYVQRVSELVPVGTAVLTVAATDQDSGVHGRLTYRVASGDPRGHFAVFGNGTLVTSAPLDREQLASYQLIVVAEDSPGSAHHRRSSSAQVTITVEDANDEVPRFISPNRTWVLENVAPNHVVLPVVARDDDAGRNGDVEYLLEPVPDNVFTLDPVKGLLRVSGPLDREQRDHYTLQVTARDRGRPANSAHMQITVLIGDENDNAPIFAPRHYSASLTENATIGSAVLNCTATDADDALNGRVRYSIVAGDGNHDFSVGEHSGVLRVAKQLNFERRSEYRLTLQAEDSSGAGRRYDTASATVAVLDINDNAPVFQHAPYVLLAMENQQRLPAPLATLQARDADAPGASLFYTIKEGDRSTFKIDPTSGQISVIRSLDREERDQYTLLIAATDNGHPRLTGTGVVQVLVQDRNDHAPVFDELDYLVTVPESVPVGTHVLHVTAQDADDGVNAIVRYELMNAESSAFTIDSATGEIRTSVLLDRERQAGYTLTVLATDSSLTHRLNAATNVTVLLQDINDSPPQFSSTAYDVTVPNGAPDGTFVFSASAWDADAGDNGRLEYSMSGTDGSRFDVDRRTGVVRTAGQLSGRRSYSVVLTAADGGAPPRRASVELKVHLQPAAVFPKFRPAPRAFRLSERVRDQVVTSLVADPPRGASTAAVRYSIVGGNLGAAFELHPVTGELRISSLGMDYEVADQYRLWVEAAVGDEQRLATYTDVTVNVTDFNDNAPQFERSSYRVGVMEDQQPPQSAVRVQATDADTGDNAKISYRLRPDGLAEEFFTLDTQSGEILVRDMLDRETTDRYTLVVEAIDQGSPQLTSTATVVVEVKDKNDNPPRFSRLFSVNVTENAEVGAFVIQVTSSDRDIGDNAKAEYSFTENPEGRFAIDALSGNVTVAAAIDREERDEYVLKVLAVDGSWRAETPLSISIQDMNDNAPIFSKHHYVFNVPESKQTSVPVGRVQASDRDKASANSEISFSLKQPSDLFSVDPGTGQIYSKRTLRYRKSSHTSSPENQFVFELIASDHGKPPMSSMCSVTVNIVDANNNAPKFSEATHSSPVLESVSVGDRIVRVHAEDTEDSGINALVHYTALPSNGSRHFTVDHETGWVSVKKRLFGQTGVHFVLRIRAEDQGLPPQHDDTSLTLVVTGRNRHAPRLSAAIPPLIVSESDPVGTIIYRLKASDADSGPNGDLRYFITGGNEEGLFAVDRITGVISNAKLLDYDTQDKYNFTVEVRDGAFRPLSISAQISVTLGDIDDNAPEFNRSEYEASISENAPVGTAVLHLTATDRDSSRYATILYSIIGGTGKGLFSIDENSGLISSRRSFDFEKTKQYTLDVLASNPSSSQRGQTQVRVFIQGVNEFFPKFVQREFRFTVSETALEETIVGSILAADEDAGEDGVVSYLLVGSSNDRGFRIERSTGQIRVARRLDRESRNRVVLTVMAKNAGSIRGNDTDEAQVSITVQDGNDPPQFSQRLYAVDVSEGAPPGTEVLAVRASDRDVNSANSQFVYSILDGDRDGVFEVDPRSGRIATMSGLDREKTERYELLMGAIDAGTPPQTGTAVVRVSLTDVNDNRPHFSGAVDGAVEGRVAENQPAGSLVMTLSASDADLPPNGAPFSYYLVGGEHRSLVAIAKTSGRVTTTRTLDREVTPELHFSVEVHDSGRPLMKAQHPVRVLVADQNDSPSTPRTVRVLIISPAASFPGGPVADVRPNDADSSGDYRCQLLDASGVFSISEGCQLSAGRVDGARSFSVKSIGSDGVHPEVTSSVQVQFSSFNESSLQEAVVVRVLNTTSRRLLDSMYMPLLDAVAGQMAPQDRVVVCSLTETEEHVDLTLIARTASDRVMGRTDLIQRLKAARSRIQRALGRASFRINYDPCPLSPCQNGGRCSSQIGTAGGYQTADSPGLVVTSRAIRNQFRCSCGAEFAGARCQHSRDPCRPNPCEAGGVCAAAGYRFSCSCPAGRTGDRCETAARTRSACSASPCRNGGQCRDDGAAGHFCLCRDGYRGAQCQLASDGCRPNPCQNGGTCVRQSPGGHHTCLCPPFFYGRYCNQSSWGFDQLSYLAFDTLDPVTNDVSVTFSTNKPDGLLVYNFGTQTGGRSDFVALQLSGGRPLLAYGGARTAITRVTLPLLVTDSSWYRLTATRNGKVVSLSVVRCQDELRCPDCNTDSSQCQHAAQKGTAGTLNFESPMYVGGVPSIDAIQERPGQVTSDDFVGCIQSVYVNGRRLELDDARRSRGVLDRCPRAAAVCAGSPCGPAGACLDRWSRRECVCAAGAVRADSCDAALQASSFQGGRVEFRATDQHRRRQRVPQLFQHHGDVWRRKRELLPHRAAAAFRNYKWLSFRVRTVDSDGLLLYAASNNDFTVLQLKDSQLIYTSRSGSSPVINMTTSDAYLTDGSWHNVTLAIRDVTLQLLVDGRPVGDALHASTVHDFLDAYLSRLTLGGGSELPDVVQRSVGDAVFLGCLSTLTINGQLQPFNGSGELLQGRVVGQVTDGCLTALASTDPLSIGITLVIVFFVILFVAIAASFVVFRLRRHKQLDDKAPAAAMKSGNGVILSAPAAGAMDAGYADNAPLTEGVLRGPAPATRKYPPRPDVLEREVVNRSPAGPQMSHIDSVSQQGVPESVSEFPEHYDLENASSIAPSDIDVVYHYKGYRDGNVRRYKTNPHVMQQYPKHSHRHSPHSFVGSSPMRRESPRSLVRQSPNPLAMRQSPGALKMQSTPLARLSPSSELSQQPRILTLQDISGKPLPTALLSAAAVTSERSLNSPVSHLSRSSGSLHAPHPQPPPPERNNNNSSLVNTVDAVSSGSEGRNKQQRRRGEPTVAPPIRDRRASSSSDESGNDSFTCSEFEYENQYDKVARDFGPQNMIFSKLAEVDNENDTEGGSTGKRFDGLGSFRGSLSTLVASDDDIANMHSYKTANNSAPSAPPSGLAGWDYLLNWGPNFESLVGVFKDIGELPDTTGGAVAPRSIPPPSMRNSNATPKPSEEYV